MAKAGRRVPKYDECDRMKHQFEQEDYERMYGEEYAKHQRCDGSTYRNTFSNHPSRREE